MVGGVAQQDDHEDLLQRVENQARNVFSRLGDDRVFVVVAEIGAGVGSRIVTSRAGGRSQSPRRGRLDRVARRSGERLERHEDVIFQLAQDLTNHAHVIVAG